jgi:hypothetical protein
MFPSISEMTQRLLAQTEKSSRRSEIAGPCFHDLLRIYRIQNVALAGLRMVSNTAAQQDCRNELCYTSVSLNTPKKSSRRLQDVQEKMGLVEKNGEKSEPNGRILIKKIRPRSSFNDDLLRECRIPNVALAGLCMVSNTTETERGDSSHATPDLLNLPKNQSQLLRSQKEILCLIEDNDQISEPNSREMIAGVRVKLPPIQYPATCKPSLPSSSDFPKSLAVLPDVSQPSTFPVSNLISLPLINTAPSPLQTKAIQPSTSENLTPPLPPMRMRPSDLGKRPRSSFDHASSMISSLPMAAAAAKVHRG